jgi:tripartite-type tricarboxylate transporter receptor subunit TctC
MKFPHRRQFLHLAAGAAALPAVSRIASAQVYPTRPITMIVPFAAGGPTDVVARIIAERARISLGQTLVVENVGGRRFRHTGIGTRSVDDCMRGRDLAAVHKIRPLSTHHIATQIPMQWA